MQETKSIHRNESYLNVVCSCCIEHADSCSPDELQLNDKQLFLPLFNENGSLGWEVLQCSYAKITIEKWKVMGKLGGERRNNCCLYYWKFASTLILGDKFNFTSFRLMAGCFGRSPTLKILSRDSYIGSSLKIAVMLSPLCLSMEPCHQSSCCKFTIVLMLIKNWV